MSFNGSGTFVINSSGQPVVTNTVISSTAFNALTTDLGTGLSTTITKDGQSTTTAKIPFTFGLSAAAASNFAAGTVAAPGIYLSTDTGTGMYRIGANNYGFAVSGAKVLDIASTGLAVTGTLSATGAITGTAAAGGNVISHSSGYGFQITADNAVDQLRLTRTGSVTADFRNYVSGNSWYVADLSGTGGSMSFSSAGVLSLSSALPVASGGTGATSVTAYAVVTGNSGGTGYSSVAPGTNGNVLTSNGTAWTSAALAVPSAASTAVTQTGTSTTTYVTPGGLNGALGFSAGFTSSDQTITSGGALTLAHSLGRIPIMINAYLVCQTSEAGYTAGQVTPTPLGGFVTTGTGLAVVPDVTNLNVRFTNVGTAFVVPNFSTGALTALTNANWKVRFYAFG